PEKVAVIHRAERAMPLAEVEELVRGVDLILIEGYGQEAIPKVEVRRSGIGFDKPPPVGPRIALVADGDGDALALSFEDIPALVDRIEDQILFNSSRPASAARRPSP
ncbi:MAG: molybdopterin-guanine dinucleotide biosynthesis protein MobB, partial [Armatimonadetes bacterium]|nr:molybdopterin-guanine dinucleotide biosynthesis protein MobB [Armatimonadota bacterium]